MAKRGRKSKLTPKTVEILCNAAAEGRPPQQCAALARINFGTLRLWERTARKSLKAGKRDKYTRFLEKITVARKMGKVKTAETELVEADAQVVDSGGQSSLMTKDVVRLVCAAANRGLTWKHCAAYAGITYQMLLRWRALGRKGQGDKFQRFLEETEEARAQGAMVHANTILDKAKKDPKWAAWALKVFYGYQEESKAISLRGRVEHNHKGGVLLAPAVLDPDQWNQLQDTYNQGSVIEAEAREVPA